MMKDTPSVLLIGSGFMAKEYLKVLAGLNAQVTIIGRGQEKIDLLKSDYPQYTYYPGGLEKFINAGHPIPAYAINASSINQLLDTTLLLLKAGVRNILLEKPGGLTISGMEQMANLTAASNANISIAYNRRFGSSVLTLLEEIEKDGGAIGAHFEFTEWIHTIDPKMYDSESLDKWVLSNSSHVIDTVFYLIGPPMQLHAMVQGKDEIEWHRSGSVFVGSGLSEKNIPFTYHSNWNSPGRWAIEILTRNRRFYLKPLEKLFVQLKGSVQVNEFPIDDSIDKEYKAGLFLQTQKFLANELSGFCTVDEQKQHFKNIYAKIAGYQAL